MRVAVCALQRPPDAATRQRNHVCAPSNTPLPCASNRTLVKVLPTTRLPALTTTASDHVRHERCRLDHPAIRLGPRRSRDHLHFQREAASSLEDIRHEAISAVAVAQASRDFISELGPWRGVSPEDHASQTFQIRKEGQLNCVRSVGQARSALARASAWDPTLRRYLTTDLVDGQEEIYMKADEIMAHLRAGIDGG